MAETFKPDKDNRLLTDDEFNRLTPITVGDAKRAFAQANRRVKPFIDAEEFKNGNNT